MSGQGNALTVAEKKIIVNIKKYFDDEKRSEGRKYYLTKSASSLTAVVTELSVTTIQRVMKEYKETGGFTIEAPKGSSPYAVDDNIKTVVQDIIRKHNIAREHLSIRLLTGILKDKHDIDIPRETLRTSLSRWDIVYGTVSRHSALRERDYVVNARREYLIEKMKLDLRNQTMVYLDETFINKNYSGSDKAWYCADWKDDPDLDKSHGPYINKPAGKGERLIVLNAVTKDGWVKGAECVFKSNLMSGDYHGAMNENNFKKWFTEQLLPNIPDNSVIVMDNASYHNTYKEDGVPSLNSKKVMLQKWLDENGVSYGEKYLRSQLIELINNFRPKRVFTLDDILLNDPILKKRNIRILRTPQYHPELQPIEKCWAVIKQYMAQHCDFTTKGLRENLKEAWKKVTKTTMTGVLKKVDFWQKYHCEQDELLDLVDDSECS
jgi:transposase